MKLLVADDSNLYRKMLKTLLEAWGYEVVLAADGLEAKSILSTNEAPSLAILDCIMPGLSGLELCEMIRSRKQGYIYTILLSAQGEQADVIKGFELGADDYLRKPFEELELRARLKAGERIIRAQGELIAAREALQFEATHDSLLRMWNRRAILEALSREMSRAKRVGTALSIFLADLDFFKRINDSFGHLVGDDVLRAAAARMSASIREYDYVGRYGGEEFLVVLPDCNLEGAHQIAERVRQRISGEPILELPAEIEITASLGVAQSSPGQSVTELLHKADVALYAAKNNGRNRVVSADAESGLHRVATASNRG